MHQNFLEELGPRIYDQEAGERYPRGGVVIFLASGSMFTPICAKFGQRFASCRIHCHVDNAMLYEKISICTFLEDFFFPSGSCAGVWRWCFTAESHALHGDDA